MENMLSGLKMIMKSEEKFMSIFKDLFKTFDFDEDEEFLYEEDYNDSWFHQKYCESTNKNKLKKNLQDKLFTDKKLTFEEYTTLLEIVVDKFRESFNCSNGKFDIIFRERNSDDNIKRIYEDDKEK